MELTQFENLALLMLCDLYKDNVEDGEFDPSFIKEAIYSRNTWALEDHFHGIPTDSISRDVVSEVHDILDMWGFIEEASDRAFPGFDNSRESDHAMVAQFITERMGRFTGLQGRVNHGILGLEGYRRMLKKFLPLRSSLADRGDIRLTEQEVSEIVAETVHPDNR
jgi:uncharacterized protein